MSQKADDELPSLEEVLTGRTITRAHYEEDEAGDEWLVLELDSGFSVHFHGSTVTVHPQLD